MAAKDHQAVIALKKIQVQFRIITDNIKKINNIQDHLDGMTNILQTITKINTKN